MTKTEFMLKQIQAAINSQDQLVFVYRRGEDDVVTRFVTPFEIKEGREDMNVRCIQHLPAAGIRNFSASKIEEFRRVISREAPINPETLESF